MMFNQRTHRGQINSFGIVHKECAMRIIPAAIGAPSIGSASEVDITPAEFRHVSCGWPILIEVMPPASWAKMQSEPGQCQVGLVVSSIM
jgi:hypothetical protein